MSELERRTSEARIRELTAAIEGLLLCCELNLDDMEDDTHYQIENAQAVLAKARQPA